MASRRFLHVKVLDHQYVWICLKGICGFRFCAACHRCPGKYQAMMAFFICASKIGLHGALPAHIEFVPVPWVKPTKWHHLFRTKNGHSIKATFRSARVVKVVCHWTIKALLSFIKVLVSTKGHNGSQSFPFPMTRQRVYIQLIFQYAYAFIVRFLFLSTGLQLQIAGTTV